MREKRSTEREANRGDAADGGNAAHDAETPQPSLSLSSPLAKTDWCVKARVVDGTWGAQPSSSDTAVSTSQQQQNSGGAAAADGGGGGGGGPRFPVLVMFFAPTPEALPQPRRGGGAGCVSAGCDIVRVHRAQVCDYVYQGQRGRNLVAKVGPAAGHPASYLLFDGRAAGANDFGEAADAPYRSSSRGFSWEPEAEPGMLEALRLLSSYLAARAREAEAAFAAAAAEAAGEREGGGGVGGGEGALAAAAPPPPLLMGPPPSAVRHLGCVLRGEAGGGSFDLGPVRVEAVEREEGGSTVLWVFDGSDAPPLGRGNAPATATLSRLSAVLAAASAAAAAAAAGGGGGGENVAVVDDVTAAAVNGADKAPGPARDDVVVPAAPARELGAAALPEAIRSSVLGPGSGAVGRRRAPPAALLASLPPVGTALPVVLALPRGAPAPALPSPGEWVTLHKLAAAAVGPLGGQAVGVFLESSHWARAAAAAAPAPPPFRADPCAREREGDTASWAPGDRSLLVAVPLEAPAATGNGGKKKRGRAGEGGAEGLPARRATLRALTLRAREAGAGSGAAAAVRARVLCRVLRAEPRSLAAPPSSSSSSCAPFDVDLVLEDATGIVEARLRGREAEAFFCGRTGGAAPAPGGSGGVSLAERCAGLVAGGSAPDEPGAAASVGPPWPWAELVLEASAGGAAAVSRGKKRRGGGGGGGGGGGEGGATGADAVAFAVADSVSRWPLPSSSSPPASPAPGSAPSPLAATQMVPRRSAAAPAAAAAVGGSGEAALAATQAPPPPPLLLAATQAVPGRRDEQQQLEQTQAVPPAAAAGLAETFVLSPLRRMTAAVRAALPGGGGVTGQGEL